MSEFPIIHNIIKHGIAGDTSLCREYAELLLQKLTEQGARDIEIAVIRSAIYGPRPDAVKLSLAGDMQGEEEQR